MIDGRFPVLERLNLKRDIPQCLILLGLDAGSARPNLSDLDLPVARLLDIDDWEAKFDNPIRQISQRPTPTPRNTVPQTPCLRIAVKVLLEIIGRPSRNIFSSTISASMQSKEVPESSYRRKCDRSDSRSDTRPRWHAKTAARRPPCPSLKVFVIQTRPALPFRPDAVRDDDFTY